VVGLLYLLLNISQKLMN